MADDETVSQFMAIAACQDTDTAVSYLEMSGGNLETAVGLFMEHSTNPTSMDTGSSLMNPSNVDDTSSSAPLIPNASFGDYDGVRAPDQTRTERLVGGPNPDLDHILPGLLRHQDMREVMRPLAFADSDDEEDGVRIVSRDIREQINQAAAGNGDAAATNGNGTTADNTIGQQATKLSNMFAPPNHILHRAGGFQGARAVARDSRRWLLVNLQRDSEFSCHALNRDVWANDLVENLIISSFIFWQAMDDTSEGATYVERYNVTEFPHVAIVDPRTGRLMWKKEGWTQEKPMDAEEFSQKAADFCSLHSFDKPPSASKQGGKVPNRPAKRPVEDLSEQEQLAKAIRESQGINDSMDDDDDEGDYVMADSGDDDDDEEEVVEVPPPEPSPPTFEEEICSMKVGEEPSEGGARLQFRMPDGGRVVRKFRNEDDVKIIYAFVAQSSDEGKTGKAFALRAGFPPKDLIDKVSETIGSCSLSGESVTVRWK